jgi:hypothetical protein
MRKAGGAIVAAVLGTLVPETIQQRVVNLDASDFALVFITFRKHSMPVAS